MGAVFAGNVASNYHFGSDGSDAASSAAPGLKPLPALKVLTIGDSIMNGFRLSAGQAWPSLVAINDGFTVTNDACDGAGVVAIGAYDECDSTFGGVISSAAALDPDIVIFEGSSNDFGEDNADLVAATTADLQAIRTEFPKAEIVGLSTLWGFDDPPDQLADVNAQVKQAVTEVGGTFVDIGQPMFDHPELMQWDDVHPDADGQAVLATTIEAAIQPAIAVALQAQRSAKSSAGGIQRFANATHFA
jgi:acyl-CoA thioesterase-1